MPNFFEQFANTQMNGAQRAANRREERTEARRREKHIALSEKEAPMVLRGLQKKMAESAELAKHYRRWRAEVKQELVERNGPDLKELMRLLRGLQWEDVQRVVDYVRDAWWLRRADESTRTATLSYIDESIARSRVRYGLAPMDDGLPGEPDGPFIQIRKLVMGY